MLLQIQSLLSRADRENILIELSHKSICFQSWSLSGRLATRD